MNKTFKKILTTTIIGVGTAGAIGCATPNSKLAEKINNGMNDFVSSINKLDYVDTSTSNSNLGKIVSAAEEANFFSKVAKTNNIENTITRPADRSDNFKLYVLSDSPFISLTSNDNSISLSMQFSTEKIENTSDDISEKINKLILKRAILMVYVNEIYNGNVALSEENRTAINAYVNVIKENASFLNGNRGMVKNQLDMASDLINSQSNDSIVNYYIIKSGEALEIRSNKIDSTISAIDSITNILEQNLTSSSCYYQNNLTNAYNNMITNMKNNSSSDNENQVLAKQIAESINLFDENNTNYDSEIATQPLNIVNNKSVNNSNCIDCKNTTKNSVINNNGSTTNTTNNLNNRQVNQNLNNNLTNKQLNQNSENNTTLNNNNIMTLEEKTQNNSKISENRDNFNENSRNFKNMTPAQRERIRRQRKYNTTNNNSNTYNPTLDTNQNNVINNSKTVRNERNNTPTSTTNQKQNSEINIYDNGRYNNRAVRVPYTINSNIND